MTGNARGRDIIVQILGNMRTQTEELCYSTIVSSSYNVHLHPDDFARLEGLIPEIVSQARRALDEELERLNRSRPLEDRVRRWTQKPRVPFQRVAAEWTIGILPDANEELEPGDILVDATLVTSDAEGYDGSATRRIVTHRRGEHVEHRVALAEPDPAPPRATPGPRPLATLRWSDQQGDHVFQMVTPSIKVGRGGAAYWVDVKVDAALDVSREHVRIRYDEPSRRFFIQDLSAYGTTVGGAALPARPAEPPDAAPTEAPLSAHATIVLAGVVALRFDADEPA